MALSEWILALVRWLVLFTPVALFAIVLAMALGAGFVLDPFSNASSVGFSPPNEHGLNTLRGDLGGLFLASLMGVRRRR